MFMEEAAAKAESCRDMLKRPPQLQDGQTLPHPSRRGWKRGSQKFQHCGKGTRSVKTPWRDLTSSLRTSVPAPASLSFSILIRQTASHRKIRTKALINQNKTGADCRLHADTGQDKTSNAKRQLASRPTLATRAPCQKIPMVLISRKRQ
jgi:hypothetical protein